MLLRELERAHYATETRFAIVNPFHVYCKDLWHSMAHNQVVIAEKNRMANI